MGESGLHPPPLLRNAEIVPENDHVIARLEVLVPFRVELVEVGQEWEETTERRVEAAIDAPVGESFGNIVLEVICQERFESIHVSLGVVQLPDESDLRRIRHKNLLKARSKYASLKISVTCKMTGHLTWIQFFSAKAPKFLRKSL